MCIWRNICVVISGRLNAILAITYRVITQNTFLVFIPKHLHKSEEYFTKQLNWFVFQVAFSINFKHFKVSALLLIDFIEVHIFLPIVLIDKSGFTFTPLYEMLQCWVHLCFLYDHFLFTMLTYQFLISILPQ